MADKPANKSKRRVKNPETFRERAVKAAETSGKPKRSAGLRRAGSKVTGPVFGPAAQALGKLFSLKPFRLVGKILLPVYIRRSWHELRLVTWPSWKESRRLTVAVLIFAVVFGASIALVDYGLDIVFKHILLK